MAIGKGFVKEMLRSLLNVSDAADSHPSPTNEGQRIYRDEPLLMRASDLKSRLPEEYHQLRQLSRELGHRLSDAELFHRQAKLLEGFEDHYTRMIPFTHPYYPTYRDMNTEQLRTYFTWRAAVRHGQMQNLGSAYAKVYLYELLMQIDCAGPEDAAKQLKGFLQTCEDAEILADVCVQGEGWLQDFLIVHRLAPDLYPEYFHVPEDEALAVLLQDPIPEDNRLFPALCALSTHHVEKSPVYKARPELTVQVLCRVYRDLCAYYHTHGQKTWPQKLFGLPLSEPWYPFNGAVVFRQYDTPEQTVVLSPIRSYQRRGPRWYRVTQFPPVKNRKLHSLMMRTTDRYLREHFAVKATLKPKDSETKIMQRIVERAVKDLCPNEPLLPPKQKKKKEQAAPVPPPRQPLQLDLSLLEGIRAASEITGAKLMTEEERFVPSFVSEVSSELPTPAPQVQTVPGGSSEAAQPLGQLSLFDLPVQTEASQAPPYCTPAPVLEEPPSHDDPLSLTEQERSYLQLLLSGQDPAPFLRTAGISEDLLVDDINEHLYDEIGDTVLEFGPEGPALLEDYIEDVKELLHL